ncbi:hypothetical protein SODG_005119 [Sodalis praecaptivus]
MPPTGSAADVLTELAKTDGATKIGSQRSDGKSETVQQALTNIRDETDKKFDKTGGTVNGPMTVEGNQLVLKGNDRKHLGFHNQDGSVRMWLYKDKGGDGVRLNNGNDGGGDWVFNKNGNFYAPSGIVAGGNITVSWGGRTAHYLENGDVEGPVWGGALSGYLYRTFVTNMRLTGIAWTGVIGNGEHLWNNGGVIVGIQSTANYATNLRVAVRYLQKWVGGSWVGIVSD